MGHERLRIEPGYKRLNERFFKDMREKQSIFIAIADLCALPEEAQKEKYADLCLEYGRAAVLRLCCDLVVLSSGDGIPLPIWDYATKHCSRTPAVPSGVGGRITEAGLTRLFRTCIITEQTDGKSIFARGKKQISAPPVSFLYKEPAQAPK